MRGMRPIGSTPFALALILSVHLLSTPSGIAAEPQMRQWVDVKGRKIDAKLITVEGRNAVLELENGKRFRYDLEKLSADDNQFITDWQSNPTFDTSLLKNIGSWPREVSVDNQVEITPVKEDAAEKEYIYRSEHFEFHLDFKLNKLLIKDWAYVFEATFKTVSEIPWNINPEAPEDLFKTYVYANRSDYIKAGGSPSSAGIYMLRSRRIMIPAASFGIKKERGEYKKIRDVYDVTTLVHEITHQVMHEWLPDIPMWLAEGAAEYVSTIPYRGGRFNVANAKRGAREYIQNSLRYSNMIARSRGMKEKSREIDMIPLEELIPMSAREFQTRGATLGQAEAIRAYYSSLIFTYYLMHVDDRGQGRGIISYIDKIGERRRVLAPYRAKFEAYYAEREQFEAGLKAGKLTKPPARPELPGHLAPYLDGDEWEAKCREIFLQGRSIEKLETELKEAYKRMGIKVK